MTKEPKELYNGFLFLRTGDKVDSPLGAYTLNLESVNIDCLEEEFEEKIEALKNGKDVTIKLVCNKAEVVSPERIIEYAYGDQKQPEIEPESISKWKKEFREYVDSLDIARDDWKGIIEYIDEVPSSQPDVIRCKDCEWWTKQENSIQGRCALHKMYPSGNWYCGTARRRGEQHE